MMVVPRGLYIRGLAIILYLLTYNTVMDRPQNGVHGSVLFQNNSDGNLDSLFDFFDVPYTSLGLVASEFVTGNVYYSSVLCNDIFPRPNAVNASSDGSILLLDDFDECPEQRVALAKQAGYNAVLFHANKSIRFTDNLISMGFPIALINSEKARIIKDSILYSNDTFTDYTITVSGTILLGILVVVFSCCVGTICICCTAVWSCICCILCLDGCCDNSAARAGGDRDDLVESIMRRLQEMEANDQARIAYGQDRTNKLPVKVFRKKSAEDTNCAVCVDEIEDGESVKQLPCGHVYHVKCIDEWLSRYSSLCPLCKYNLRNTRQPAATESTPLTASVSFREDRLGSTQ